MKPLLSICIPTYNRCEYLKKSIESIICQPEFKSGDVEIVISDNASKDNTEQVVREYSSKYSNVLYFGNSKNIGIENFPFVLSKGSGIFRRLCNDTFIFHEESLRTLCDYIIANEDNRTPVFFLNGEKNLGADEWIICDSFDQVAVDLGYWLGWSGAFGIWEDDCFEIENDVSGCELLFWQTRKACDMINEKKKAIICNKKLLHVQNVDHKDLSYGLYQVFYINLLSIFKKYVDIGVLSCEAYEKIRKDLLYSFFTLQIIMWETKYSNAIYDEKENPKELVFEAYKGESYWSDYLKYYKKQKAIFLLKKKAKAFLEKTYIWDFLIMLHIKKE